MRLLAFTVLALAACSPEPEPAPEPAEEFTNLPATGGADNPAPAPPSQALSPIETLAGEWRVAGIDGEPFDEPYGLALSANEEEIWWEPRCAGLARGYAIEGTRITVGSPTANEPRAADGSQPVCDIAIPSRLGDVARALDAAEIVGRTESNGILLEGGGHSLTLYSQ